MHSLEEPDLPLVRISFRFNGSGCCALFRDAKCEYCFTHFWEAAAARPGGSSTSIVLAESVALYWVPQQGLMPSSLWALNTKLRLRWREPSLHQFLRTNRKINDWIGGFATAGTIWANERMSGTPLIAAGIIALCSIAGTWLKTET